MVHCITVEPRKVLDSWWYCQGTASTGKSRRPKETLIEIEPCICNRVLPGCNIWYFKTWRTAMHAQQCGKHQPKQLLRQLDVAACCADAGCRWSGPRSSAPRSRWRRGCPPAARRRSCQRRENPCLQQIHVVIDEPKIFPQSSPSASELTMTAHDAWRTRAGCLHAAKSMQSAAGINMT